MPKVVSQKGRYVRMTIDFWYQEDDKSIHIASTDDPRFHTTVNDNVASIRRHTNLFGKLARILRENGKMENA